MANLEIDYKKAAQQLRSGEALFGKDGALAPMREENFITSFLCHSLYRFIEIPIPTSSLYPDTFFLKM